MRSLLMSLTLLIFVGTSAGCQTQQLFEKLAGFKPNPNDYRDAGDDPGAEWDFVGDEGRSEQATEFEADDQWFKKHLMSARARSIERNLGFE